MNKRCKCSGEWIGEKQKYHKRSWKQDECENNSEGPEEISIHSREQNKKHSAKLWATGSSWKKFKVNGNSSLYKGMKRRVTMVMDAIKMCFSHICSDI